MRRRFVVARRGERAARQRRRRVARAGERGAGGGEEGAAGAAVGLARVRRLFGRRRLHRLPHAFGVGRVQTVQPVGGVVAEWQCTERQRRRTPDADAAVGGSAQLNRHAGGRRVRRDTLEVLDVAVVAVFGFVRDRRGHDGDAKLARRLHAQVDALRVVRAVVPREAVFAQPREALEGHTDDAAALDRPRARRELARHVAALDRAARRARADAKVVGQNPEPERRVHRRELLSVERESHPVRPRAVGERRQRASHFGRRRTRRDRHGRRRVVGIARKGWERIRLVGERRRRRRLVLVGDDGARDGGRRERRRRRAGRRRRRAGRRRHRWRRRFWRRRWRLAEEWLEAAAEAAEIDGSVGQRREGDGEQDAAGGGAGGGADVGESERRVELKGRRSDGEVLSVEREGERVRPGGRRRRHVRRDAPHGGA